MVMPGLMLCGMAWSNNSCLLSDSYERTESTPCIAVKLMGEEISIAALLGGNVVVCLCEDLGVIALPLWPHLQLYFLVNFKLIAEPNNI